MQILASALSQHLSKELKPLYTLHGDEALLQLEAANAIRAAARTLGFTERSVFNVQGANFDWSQVLHAGQSMGLFGDKQLIEVRIPSGKPGREGSLALQSIAESTQGNDSILYLFTLPRLDKATQSSGWFAALDSCGVSIKIDSIERHALPAWIALRLKAQGQSVSEGLEGQTALQFFADRVEGNLLAAHQEIQKLSLLYPKGELSLSQIEAAVLNVARYDVFKLSDAMLSGKAERSQRMIDGLQAEGEAAVLVHWAIAQEIQTLSRLVDLVAAGRPVGVALRELRVWGPRERHLERLVPMVSATSANRLLQAAHIVDGIVKGVAHADWPKDPWQALQRLSQQVVRLSA